MDGELVGVAERRGGATTGGERKGGVGRAVETFARGVGGSSRREGGRCWTRDYGRVRFHLDVLPAIPNPDGGPTGILLADRNFPRWLPSDPKSYREWFRERMKLEMLERRVAPAAVRK